MRRPWRRGDRASSLELLVVGLGNPGREYAGNRHNVGWMVVEELARRHGASWKGKFSGQFAELRLDGHRVGLLKPETFMNESGRSVSAAVRFFKLEPDAVLVVHDEIDLEPGRLQARSGGGLAGHNGLRSIAAHLKTPDFLRLPRANFRRRGTSDRSPISSRRCAAAMLAGPACDASVSRSSVRHLSGCNLAASPTTDAASSPKDESRGARTSAKKVKCHGYDRPMVRMASVSIGGPATTPRRISPTRRMPCAPCEAARSTALSRLCIAAASPRAAAK